MLLKHIVTLSFATVLRNFRCDFETVSLTRLPIKLSPFPHGKIKRRAPSGPATAPPLRG